MNHFFENYHIGEVKAIAAGRCLRGEANITPVFTSPEDCPVPAPADNEAVRTESRMALNVPKIVKIRLTSLENSVNHNKGN
jgi:hypothetical protein